VNDSDRLRQVLINLLSNAIKFTDTGGVLVEMQQLDQNRVALRVKDTGIGIAETDLQHLFKEFWQADQSTTRSSQRGTGLGLTIVDKLVRLMKGTITVESKLGHGSVFHIELPYQTSVDA
jgi:signal transduction histidine kinase